MSTTIADAVHMVGEEEIVTVKVCKAEICGHFLVTMIMSDFAISSKTAADLTRDLLMMCGEVTAANALKSHVAFCSKP